MNERNNAPDGHLIWQEVSRKTLVETPIFSLVESGRMSPQGGTSSYYLLDAPDWANVVALTTDGEGRECFIMVRQFRHGSMTVHLEFPGGVVDPGEDPLVAASRELQEETGYRSESLELIGSVNPNPALMGNRCYTYLAGNVTSGAEQNMDHDEYIDVALVPVEDEMPPEFDHAMMLVALGFYRRWKGEKKRPEAV